MEDGYSNFTHVSMYIFWCYMSKYRATAIVSMYNSKDFIVNKIKNILESEESVEVILIDCTGGAELELIKDLTNTDQFIKVIFNERISVWKAINIGIKLANTPYVVQSNTDDHVSPLAYKKQIEKLDAGYDMAYFDYKLAAYKNTYRQAVKIAHDYYRTPKRGYSTGNGLGPFPMWRKELHERHGYFDERLEIHGDSDFWETLSRASIRWGRIPEFLGVYAYRNDNLEKNEELKKQDGKILRKKWSDKK